MQVYQKGITFDEYEDMYEILDKYKDVKRVAGEGSATRKTEEVTYKWKNVLITVGASSLFLGGDLTVNSPSRHYWYKFLDVHPKFKEYLRDITGRFAYSESREEWLRM